MSKVFYKTTITVTVLSEEPIPPDASLRDIAYNFTEGDDSGDWEITNTEFLNGKEAAAALIAQGSDPGFFGLTEDGEEINTNSDPDDKCPYCGRYHPNDGK